MANLIRWFGGKGLLAPRIIQHLQHAPHKIYVEPYCGASSVFFSKPQSEIEVLNDLHKDLINFFRVMQDSSKFNELQHRLNYTLYSRDEFARALHIIQSDEPHDVLRAWAFFVGQNQGFSGHDCGKISSENWSRSFSINHKQPVFFQNKIKRLEFFHNRLKNAYIDNIDALDCIRYWDSQDTLFYLDPPYVPDTRITKDAYHHETDNDHHRQLVDILLNIKGQAVLSGYAHEIYEPLLNAGWQKIEIETVCHAAGKIRNSNLQGKGSVMKHVPRTEVLYIHIREQNLFLNNQ